MSVAAEKLVRMAEQIAANITISKDPEVIVDRLADHMQRFWDPRMRNTLKSLVDSGEFTGSEVVRQAADRLPSGD